jgi:hypothetical protein
MHLDRSYVYRGGDHDVERLFALEDLTESVRARQGDVRRAPMEMRAALGQLEAPSIAVGPHCEQPRMCPFYLPRLTRKLRERIRQRGDRLAG